MAIVAKITGASKDFNLYEAPASGLSTAIWRHEDPTVAPIYRPTVSLRAMSNSAKTNHTMTLDVKVPVVQTVDGIASAPNKVQAKVTFTSLQGVVTPLTSETVDITIAALTALKANLVAGKVN